MSGAETTVMFERIGRGKRSWSKSFPGKMCEGMMEAIWTEVRRKWVIVGGFRRVGSFRILS